MEKDCIDTLLYMYFSPPTASGPSSEPEGEQAAGTGILDVLKALKPLFAIVAIALAMLALGYALVPPGQCGGSELFAGTLNPEIGPNSYWV